MLYVISPMLAPSIVTLVDPVPPTLPRRMMLTACSPTVNPSDLLPVRSPLVTIIWRLFVAPWTDWHRTDVSESHADVSHAVLPFTIRSEKAVRPTPSPDIVTLIEPVAAVLDRHKALLLPTTVDRPSETLPTRRPNDSDVRRLPVAPWLTSHRTAVSETHVVRSQTVLPDLSSSDCAVSPNATPSTVTLVDPVDTTLLLRPTTLIRTISDDTTLLKVPNRSPAVTLT